jgi:hypothetical protein
MSDSGGIDAASLEVDVTVLGLVGGAPGGETPRVKPRLASVLQPLGLLNWGRAGRAILRLATAGAGALLS